MDDVHGYMRLRDFLCDVLRSLEEDHEEDGHYESICSEYIPCCTPVWLGSVVNEVVYYSLCAEGSDCSSDTVGHEHEETLGAVLKLFACAHVGVEGS